ncbi:hypothetical protein P152DRAFT_83150 [Eremomyces bilateralis CBS 781.70]|uniref:Uncharacterized protein n=1 Tax=Eremomyces bilateralis CBS 781.70 TaxID=1392243 RepID=A0A6G1FYQ7_9PEZI|nr:uncharacterized protein P152DRAFT_83150 [Eremomyces bilateralis CBS 781.70]KAF1810806.1 hypothetical protein P152DRAFT_83150 [Eremomyces bilateralis CBS 781.70]
MPWKCQQPGTQRRLSWRVKASQNIKPLETQRAPSPIHRQSWRTGGFSALFWLSVVPAQFSAVWLPRRSLTTTAICNVLVRTHRLLMVNNESRQSIGLEQQSQSRDIPQHQKLSCASCR